MDSKLKTGAAMGIGIVLAMSLITQANGATCDRNYDASLKRAVSSTISAVAGNNPSALLNLISPDGVTIGAEGAFVSRADLASQFAAKTGYYCDIFSCGGKAGVMRRFFRNGPTDAQLDERNLRATVFINANTNDELQLSFRYSTQCRWEVTGIGTL
ncbi:hypothetical protein [Asticcacaulis solisilvae]|uniref:hypothetical protein n=2 Tax=Asticcacaulis TaxID=76890 RepID=UPI001AE961D1|nr:hypothetical protein [Asticcacaulis solisilvae]